MQFLMRLEVSYFANSHVCIDSFFVVACIFNLNVLMQPSGPGKHGARESQKTFQTCHRTVCGCVPPPTTPTTHPHAPLSLTWLCVVARQCFHWLRSRIIIITIVGRTVPAVLRHYDCSSIEVLCEKKLLCLKNSSQHGLTVGTLTELARILTVGLS